MRRAMKYMGHGNNIGHSGQFNDFQRRELFHFMTERRHKRDNTNLLKAFRFKEIWTAKHEQEQQNDRKE
jgi:hypothetical protein